MSSEVQQQLEQAKNLLDAGLISQDQYTQIQQRCLEQMGLAPSGGDPLGGSTVLGSEPEGSPEADGDLLGGHTVLGGDSEKQDDLLGGATILGGEELVGEDDVLGGATVLGEADLGEDDLLGGATVGLTMMGQSQSLTSENINKLPPGSLFGGRYSIISVLGEGGMGVVYRAVDTRIGQDVALKAIRPELVRRKDIVEMMTREVQLSQKLSHPNILQIRHLEINETAPYAIMELLDGGDVEELVASRGGKLSVDETLKIVDQALQGLSALHNEKIAHLDIKPANILLGKDGQAKLADFGISTRLKDQRGGGMGAGTPLYAPPEQIAGGECDVRADIYAVGMMIHELLSGGFPFEKTLSGAKKWHEHGERVFPNIPPQLGLVVARCCSVEPNGRYRSADELRNAL
ncbi:MAG: hypothetical protein CMK59_05590, partial [Proteobacteria bacterium]|nr:hypothetical protein [Pseudomonadota bacterium]